MTVGARAAPKLGGGRPVLVVVRGRRRPERRRQRRGWPGSEWRREIVGVRRRRAALEPGCGNGGARRRRVDAGARRRGRWEPDLQMPWNRRSGGAAASAARRGALNRVRKAFGLSLIDGVLLAILLAESVPMI